MAHQLLEARASDTEIAGSPDPLMAAAEEITRQLPGLLVQGDLDNVIVTTAILKELFLREPLTMGQRETIPVILANAEPTRVDDAKRHNKFLIALARLAPFLPRQTTERYAVAYQNGAYKGFGALPELATATDVRYVEGRAIFPYLQYKTKADQPKTMNGLYLNELTEISRHIGEDPLFGGTQILFQTMIQLEPAFRQYFSGEVKKYGLQGADDFSIWTPVRNIAESCFPLTTPERRQFLLAWLTRAQAQYAETNDRYFETLYAVVARAIRYSGFADDEHAYDTLMDTLQTTTSGHIAGAASGLLVTYKVDEDLREHLHMLNGYGSMNSEERVFGLAAAALLHGRGTMSDLTTLESVMKYNGSTETRLAAADIATQLARNNAGELRKSDGHADGPETSGLDIRAAITSWAQMEAVCAQIERVLFQSYKDRNKLLYALADYPFANRWQRTRAFRALDKAFFYDYTDHEAIGLAASVIDANAISLLLRQYPNDVKMKQGILSAIRRMPIERIDRAAEQPYQSLINRIAATYE